MPLFSSSFSSPSLPIPRTHQHDIRAQFSADPPPRVKIPTAPWMTSSPDLLLLSDLPSTDLSTDQLSNERTERTRSLTARIPGGRTRKSILEVIKSVKSLQKLDPIEEFEEKDEAIEEWSEEREKPKMPWVGGRNERDNEIMVFRREKKKREVTEAEKRIAPDELQRLRKEAGRITRWVKAKKAGITTEVVEEIKQTWKSNRLAMVQIVDPLRKNMDRAREIIETKTGGLVILTKKDKFVIYRQNNYQKPPLNSHNSEKQEIVVKGTLYERETDRLLNSLGPRFIDWWWRGPLPVDADLLPEIVEGFRTPSRRCPPGARLALSDAELTWLRLIARSLPTHFALGRNKKLQGLAEAIIKLWEKSLVAKIAIKVGLLNTSHVEMASELKQLTGGVVILRNKDFIILYRGKDFITENIANSITERESQIHEIQNKEEEARIKAADYFRLLNKKNNNNNYTGSSGSFREYQDLKSNFFEGENGNFEDVMRLEAEKENLMKEIKDQEKKLFILMKKIESSEREMKNLKILSGAYVQDCDKELLTEEERRTLRSIGLKMDQHLLLGRRGVYDGVISTIHQHWKHREVVKVITKQTGVISINYTAKLLELMTGGALVSVDKVRSHHEIVIYRGKNYRPPIKLLPDNLLTKREALKRSIEIQRRGSLKFFAWKREESLRELKNRMSDLEEEIAKITAQKGELPS